MPSAGNTGDWLRPEQKEKLDAAPVTGKCDSGCGKPATHWFGMTSVATCGDSKCVRYQQDRWDESLREQREQDEEDR